MLAAVKERARRENSTMREVMEAALRNYLEQTAEKPKTFRLKDRSFRGNGVREGIDEGSWEQIRGLIYEGHGG